MNVTMNALQVYQDFHKKRFKANKQYDNVHVDYQFPATNCIMNPFRSHRDTRTHEPYNRVSGRLIQC